MTSKSSRLIKRRKKLRFTSTGYGHDTDEWRDYDEDNVPFERLEKVYVLDEDSLEERMNISMDSFTVYRNNCKFRLPLELFF